MKVALLQIDLIPRDINRNIDKASRMVQDAKALGAELVVLPEVFSSGFFFLEGEEAVKAGQSSEQALKNMSQENGVYVCGTFANQKPGERKPENLFQLWGPEGRLVEYSKIHLFSYAGEDKRYQSGSQLVDFELQGFRVRPLFCYDLRFDYCFNKDASAVDLFIVPANWPSARQDHWECLLRARAIDSQAWVIGVNRVGKGGKLKYLGGSRIISPKGEIVVTCGGCEGVILGEIELDQVAQWRQEFPVLKDRLKTC